MSNQTLLPTSPPQPSRSPIDPELEQLAHWMDNAFHVPGIGVRFGLDAIIGLIPGLGDTFTSLVSLYILNAARRYGVSRVVLIRMAANIAVDYAFGSLPVLGDVFDVFWKSNQRNVALLRRHLLSEPPVQRRARISDWFFMSGLILVLLAALAGSVFLAYSLIGGVMHWLTQSR
jgi:hypothetical protein